MRNIESRPARRHKDIDYAIDDKGVLIYHGLTTEGIRILEPAKPITDPNAVIGKIGMNSINPTNFSSLKPKDLSPTVVKDTHGIKTGEPIPPGVSGFLFFGSSNTNQDRISSLSRSQLGREPRSRDTLYISQVQDINEAGWTAYYAPLITNNPKGVTNPLHALLVPSSLEKNKEVENATIEERKALVEIFVPWQSPK